MNKIIKTQQIGLTDLMTMFMFVSTLATGVTFEWSQGVYGLLIGVALGLWMGIGSCRLFRNFMLAVVNADAMSEFIWLLFGIVFMFPILFLLLVAASAISVANILTIIPPNIFFTALSPFVFALGIHYIYVKLYPNRKHWFNW